MGKFWDFLVMMLNESFPPKPTWTADDIADLTGKVIIVTGVLISSHLLAFTLSFRIIQEETLVSVSKSRRCASVDVPVDQD